LHGHRKIDTLLGFEEVRGTIHT